MTPYTLLISPLQLLVAVVKVVLVEAKGHQTHPHRI